MPTSFDKTALPAVVMEEELLNDEDVKLVIQRKLGTEDFTIKKWTLDRIPLSNGFLGQYYNLRVTCNRNDHDINDEKFTFFAKTKPAPTSIQYDLANSGNVFEREITFYEELAVKMGMGHGSKWKVDCYLGKSETIIVLEDVTLEGFVMADKFAPFEFDECVTMLYSLSKLHSRSMVLDERLRRECGKHLDEVYGDILEEGLFTTEDRSQRNFIDSSILGACSLIDLIDGLDGRVKHRIKTLIADWGWRIPRFMRTSKKYRGVLCHRDPWANNMMIKRDPKTGRLTNLYLIDFQFVRYLPAAIDFMLSIYLTTRRQTRDENFEKFAQIYHENVKEELGKENLDTEQCGFGWNVFRQSCEYYRCLAIIFVTINQQVMLIDESIANDYFTKTPEMIEKIFWGNRRAELLCPIFNSNRHYRELFIENIMEIKDNMENFENWSCDNF